MYCKNCGKQMNSEQAICLNCGVKSGQGNAYCSNCGNKVDPKASVCLNCGVAIKGSSAIVGTNFDSGIMGTISIIVLAIGFGIGVFISDVIGGVICVIGLILAILNLKNEFKASGSHGLGGYLSFVFNGALGKVVNIKRSDAVAVALGMVFVFILMISASII